MIFLHVATCISKQNFSIERIIDHCTKMSFLEAQKYITDEIAMQGVHVGSNQTLILLSGLQNELINRINSINEQIQHNYRFDQKTLKIVKWLGFATVMGCILTGYCYKGWSSSAENKAYLDIENKFKELKIFVDVGETRDGDWVTRTTTYSHLYNMIDPMTYTKFCDWVDLHKKLKEERYDSKWYLAAIFSAMASYFILHFSMPYCSDLSLKDPNEDNKNLELYKQLLCFVVQLEKEFC